MVRNVIEKHEEKITHKDKNRGDKVCHHINTLNNKDKTQIRIYNNAGKIIPEDKLEQEFLKKWSPICQSSTNNIGNFWKNEEREIYKKKIQYNSATVGHSFKILYHKRSNNSID